MTEEELWLYSLCKKNNVIITDIEIRQLTSFKNQLLEWNKKINLVSRKNEEALWKNHIALSLSILFKLTFIPGQRILDLGTGGGFPGIPLSIMLPQCSFLLLDSTQKKIHAVQSIVDSLSLQNVKTVWGRAEDLNKTTPHHHAFDIIIARSVSNLSNLLEWGLPFLKKKTQKQSKGDDNLLLPSLITFKGMEIEEEEKIAQKDFPEIQFKSVPLVFPGSEEFENLDKKLVIASFK